VQMAGTIAGWRGSKVVILGSTPLMGAATVPDLTNT
jgi:hypothetical protein